MICTNELKGLSGGRADYRVEQRLEYSHRAQSSASPLVRNVLAVAGQPVLRMRALQVPEEVLTIVALSTPCGASAASLYRNGS